MSAAEIEKYRELLVHERDRLTISVERLHDDNSTSVEDELGASATYERELDAGFEESAQHTLDEIEAALQRIDGGSYGACEACGKPIGAERLAAIPWARLCIDDKRRAG